MTYYAGIDVSLEYSSVCVVDPELENSQGQSHRQFRRSREEQTHSNSAGIACVPDAAHAAYNSSNRLPPHPVPARS